MKMKTLSRNIGFFVALATCLLLLGIPAPPRAGAQTIDVGRGEVAVQVPLGYDYANPTPTPLVILLHGYGGSGTGIESYMKLAPLADSYGFLYLHPDGTVNPYDIPFWNGTDACCDFWGPDPDYGFVDDSAYLLDLINAMKARYNVDASRVFLIGHSNGGFMAHRMACDNSDVIAAVVSFAGATHADPTDCSPTSPVRVLQIHGTADATIYYAGGDTIGGPYPGAVETLEQWAEAYTCDLPPETLPVQLDLDPSVAGAETVITRYETGCIEGGSSELWTIVGGGHGLTHYSLFTQNVVNFLFEQPYVVGNWEEGIVGVVVGYDGWFGATQSQHIDRGADFTDADLAFCFQDALASGDYPALEAAFEANRAQAAVELGAGPLRFRPGLDIYTAFMMMGMGIGSGPGFALGYVDGWAKAFWEEPGYGGDDGYDFSHDATVWDIYAHCFGAQSDDVVGAVTAYDANYFSAIQSQHIVRGADFTDAELALCFQIALRSGVYPDLAAAFEANRAQAALELGPDTLWCRPGLDTYIAFMTMGMGIGSGPAFAAYYVDRWTDSGYGGDTGYDFSQDVAVEAMYDGCFIDTYEDGIFTEDNWVQDPDAAWTVAGGRLNGDVSDGGLIWTVPNRLGPGAHTCGPWAGWTLYRNTTLSMSFDVQFSPDFPLEANAGVFFLDDLTHPSGSSPGVRVGFSRNADPPGTLFWFSLDSDELGPDVTIDGIWLSEADFDWTETHTVEVTLVDNTVTASLDGGTVPAWNFIKGESANSVISGPVPAVPPDGWVLDKGGLGFWVWKDPGVGSPASVSFDNFALLADPILPDVIVPVICLDGEQTIILEQCMEPYAEPGATATDLSGEEIPVTIGGDTVDTTTVGIYTVTYDAADVAGNEATQVTRTVIVQDTAPPEVTVTPSQDYLWPANHKMQEIVCTVIATDGCNPAEDLTITLLTVTSDESDNGYGVGDGNTTDDIQVDPDTGVISLRAERQGRGDGRVYTIVYNVTDAAGNSVEAECTVEVPHDSGSHTCDNPDCDLNT